jgi:hypothetical protein
MGNAGGGKGPQFKTDAIRGEGQGIGKPINSAKCPETADGVTRESEGRLAAKTSWRMPMLSAAPIRAPLV